MENARQRAGISRRNLVIFDFDGTLADTKPTIVRTATGVLLEWGIPEDVVATHVDELIGPPFPEAFSWVFGVSEADALEITRRYRERYFASGPEAWPLFPGVRELLGLLREQGRRVAIASSKAQQAIDRGVSDNDAWPLFDAVVGKRPGEVDTKADAIMRVLADMGCSPDDAVMVGDRFHDVEGALSCGVPCVGVTWGDTGTREELEGAGAVAVADTPDDLARVLLEVPNPSGRYH